MCFIALKSGNAKPTETGTYEILPRVGSGLRWCGSGRRSLGSPPVCSAQVCLVFRSAGFRVSVSAELGPSGFGGGERRPEHVTPPSLPSRLPPAVTNKHHFADGPILYQFRMNFRRRRRLIELLHERGRGIPENHDSPFCLRKQNSDGGNTSFLSGRSTLASTFLKLRERGRRPQ